MPHKTAIMFARQPQFGVVKTRLARDIGQLAALSFYRNNLASVSARLIKSSSFQFIVALTPETAIHEGPGPILNGLKLYPQHIGNLDQRLLQSFRAFSNGPTVIIGSDIPDIDGDAIEEAFSSLGTSDAVFGPSDDGGYWLIGLKNRYAVPHNFLKSVRWSSAYALTDSVKTLPKHWKVSYIRSLEDVDDGASHQRWRMKQRKIDI